MKAWTFNRRGPPSTVLKLQHDFPQPRPEDLHENEAIVKVSYVTMISTMQQLMAVFPHLNSNPWIPEFEFSGTIIAIGSINNGDSQSRLKVGDSVFGMINPKRATYNGVLAEYVVTPTDTISHKPDDASHLDLAGLVGDGCTALGFAESTGLITIAENVNGVSMANKAHGKRILITGGSTALGLTTLQIFKALVGDEGRVVTTASLRNIDLVRKQGADEVIDYTTYSPLSTHLTTHYSTPTKQFDVIIDITGTDPSLYPSSPAYLRSEGHFVFAGNMNQSHLTVGTTPLAAFVWLLGMIGVVLSWLIASYRPQVLGGTPRNAFFHSGTPTKKRLDVIARLVEEGRVKGVVDRVWSMEEAIQAYAYIARGGIRGKVVISVQE